MWKPTRWMAAGAVAIAVLAGSLSVSLKRSLIDNPLGVDDPRSFVATQRLLTTAEFLAVRQVDVVEDVAGFSASQFVADVSGRPEVMTVGFVTPNYFDVVKQHPVRGRLFNADEPGEAVIGERRWNELGLSPTTGGVEAIRIRGRQIRVVGAVSETFRPPSGIESIDVYLPMPFHQMDSTPLLDGPYGDSPWLLSIVRLRPGVARRDAEERISAVVKLGRGEALRDVASAWVSTRSLAQLRTSTTLFACLSIGVVLTALAAVAIAMVMAVHGQRASLSIMKALGAPRSALLRRATRENLMGTVLGGGVGMSGAFIATKLLAGARLSADTSVPMDLSPSLPAASAVLIAVFTTVYVTGFVSLFWRQETIALATYSPRLVSATPKLLRSGLLIQSALAVSLIVPGAILLSQAVSILRQPLGFSTDGVGWVTPQFAAAKIDPRTRDVVMAALLSGLESQPGVSAAAVASATPFAAVNYGAVVARPGAEGTRMGCTYVSPSYFEVLGIPVVKGSATLREREAIIDRAAVARLGLVEPVGAVIDIRVLGQFTVVGMVADATLSDREITANVFLPLTPAASSGRHLLFRSPRLVSVLPAVEQLMNRLAPGIPFSRAVSADTHVRRYFANVTTNAALGAVAAVAAMVLSVTSLGVVAARLAQLLASSLALRAVLGASQGTLAWTVARSMLPWLLGGAVNGTIAGWVLLLITGAEIDIYRVAPYVVAAALVPVIAIIGVGLKLMLGSMRVSVLLR